MAADPRASKPKPSAIPRENTIQPPDRAAWRAWLHANHARDEGIWVVTFKKAAIAAGKAGPAPLNYDQIVEECLCYGWIDSKPGFLDADRTMLWCSPRKPGSKWAATNKARVERLERDGLIAPAGRAKIDQARRDGTWDALMKSDALTVPPDLVKALRALPQAEEHFAAFPPSVRRGILEWIDNAKRAQTRAARVAQTAEMASRNERANQWRPKPAAD